MCEWISWSQDIALRSRVCCDHGWSVETGRTIDIDVCHRQRRFAAHYQLDTGRSPSRFFTWHRSSSSSTFISTTIGHQSRSNRSLHESLEYRFSPARSFGQLHLQRAPSGTARSARLPVAARPHPGYIRIHAPHPFIISLEHFMLLLFTSRTALHCTAKLIILKHQLQ